MKNKLALAACTLLSIGSAIAADQSENNRPASPAEQAAPANPDIGFGGGMNIGAGGGFGSASSLGGGLGSPVSGGVPASQTFGGGSTIQQSPNSPLATPAAAGAAGGAAAGGAAGGAAGLFR